MHSRGALSDEVGPETALCRRRRAPVQVEDGDEGTQECRGPVVEWLRVHSIEEFTAEALDARRLLVVGHVVGRDVFCML